jgi:hypothetical protein
MADDILHPLLLVPELTKLFVIDYFDSAFAKNGTWEGQKKDILEILTSGNNKNSRHREVYSHYYKKVPIYYLDDPCKIIKQLDENKCWEVDFMYKGIKRELNYFHHTNFISKWNKDISDISHVMSMGAVFPISDKKLKKMLIERTTPDCKYYDEFFEEKDTVKKEVLGRTIYINELNSVIKN